MILWIVKRHFRATEGFFVPCRRSMRASINAHAVRRDPRPKEMTAAMRLSDGGEEELRAVVARRTAMRIFGFTVCLGEDLCCGAHYRSLTCEIAFWGLVLAIYDFV